MRGGSFERDGASLSLDKRLIGVAIAVIFIVGGLWSVEGCFYEVMFPL